MKLSYFIIIFQPKKNTKMNIRSRCQHMIHNIMLSPIFVAITISYRMPNMQCHEIYANFLSV